MFILDGSNNRSSDTPQSLGASFILGTGVEITGAILAIIGTLGSSTITLPTPKPSGGGLFQLDAPMGIKTIEAVMWDGVRYLSTTGELQSGEFYWDTILNIIWIKPWQTYQERND